MRRVAITERENVLRMINRTGDPEWVPLSWEYGTGRFATPTPVLEHPKDQKDGVDWFGCHWKFDAPTFGYVQDPAYPLPCDDITEWREQVHFPDYDAIDRETLAARDCVNYDRENKLVKFILESGPFERLHSLVGFEEAMVSMYTEPEAFLDDFVEIGVQVVNPLQPINDWSAIAEKYQHSLSFEVTLSSEANMPNADEEVIRSDIRRAIDTFGPYKNFMLFPMVLEPRSMDIVRDEMQKYGRTYYQK